MVLVSCSRERERSIRRRFRGRNYVKVNFCKNKKAKKKDEERSRRRKGRKRR